MPGHFVYKHKMVPVRVKELGSMEHGRLGLGKFGFIKVVDRFTS